jgi:hypothetical protein
MFQCRRCGYWSSGWDAGKDHCPHCGNKPAAGIPIGKAPARRVSWWATTWLPIALAMGLVGYWFAEWLKR